MGNTVRQASPQTLTRRALAGAGWLSLSTGIRQALSFISVAILARLIGPESYGLMGMAALLTTFLYNFRDLGTASAIIQRPDVSGRLLSSLFWVNVSLGLLLSLITLAIAEPAARFFHEPRLEAILQALSPSFFLSSSGMVHYAMLNREMSFDKLAWSDLISALAGYAISIPCALTGFGVWSLVFANLANALAATVMYWYFLRWRPAWEFDRVEIRSVGGFSLNLAGFWAVNYFSRNADNLIVGRSLGSRQLGYYQMAYNLMVYPIQNISYVIAQVLFPAFSKIQHNNDSFRSAYVRSSMLIGFITFPMMAGLCVLADPFVRAVLGSRWIPAIILIQILAPVGLIQSVQTCVGQIYTAKGRTELLFRWAIYCTAVCVTAFLIGIRWGIIGVASAYCIAYFVLIAYPALAVPFRLIELRVRDYVWALVPQIAITLLMAAACYLSLQLLNAASVETPWVRLSTGVAIGCFVYCLAMLFWRPPVVVHIEELLAGYHPSGPLRYVRPIFRIFARA